MNTNANHFDLNRGYSDRKTQHYYFLPVILFKKCDIIPRCTFGQRGNKGINFHNKITHAR